MNAPPKAPAAGYKRATSDRALRYGFALAGVLLFVAGVAATIGDAGAMAAMGGLPMPGGWQLSMGWLRMDGETWRHAAATFLRMWMAMTLAMMLPVLAPALARYRRQWPVAPAAHLAGLTALVALAYFMVWAALGLAVYPSGVALAALAIRRPALAALQPIAAAALVAGAGLLQSSAWKRRRLARCRGADHAAGPRSAGLGHAWRHGLRLGLHCNACCAPLTLVLLSLGAMDLRVMTTVSAAIAAERLVPGGQHFARASGALMMATGGWMGCVAWVRLVA